MFQHLNKENYKILIKALKNEPLPKIFKNALNKLLGKSNLSIADIETIKKVTIGEFSFLITQLYLSETKQLVITGIVYGANKPESISLMCKKKKELTVLNLFKVNTQEQHLSCFRFEAKVKSLNNPETLVIQLRGKGALLETEVDIRILLGAGNLDLLQYQFFTNPNPTHHKSRSKHIWKYSALDSKLIAFYLPQFHQIKENDEWWGAGFTEWTNVTKSLPKFKNHYQPRLPADLGFYDLSNANSVRAQIDLAKQYGIYGFCFHHYWFSGRTLLDTPINHLFEDKSIEFNYCINWANENWTRSWDGANSEILIEQNYELSLVRDFYQDIKKFFHDKRYIKVDGKPIFMIYRVHDISNVKAWIAKLRQYAQEDGFNDLHILACQSISIVDDPKTLGLDGTVEFPPHHLATQNKLLDQSDYNITELVRDGTVVNYSNAFKGDVFNYAELVSCSYSYTSKSDQYECVFPSWDNTARKNNFGTPFIYSTPIKYATWLNNALRRTQEKTNKLLFINAWNEWAEGAYLEPDRHFGCGYLNKTSEILAYYSNETSNKSNFSINGIQKKHNKAIVLHLYYTEMWDELSAYIIPLKNQFDIYISITEDHHFFKKTIKQNIEDAHVVILTNQGRDVGPFLQIMNALKFLDYKYIVKLHSKKSPHAINGNYWRNYSFESLIGNSNTINQIIAKFETDPLLGVVTGFKNVFSFKRWGLGSNENAMEKISRLMGILEAYKQLEQYCKFGQLETLDTYEENTVKFNKNESILDEPYLFPAGTMFWFRPEALMGLFELGWDTSDFPKEHGQLDGTTAHAVERMIGLLAKTNGFKMGFVKS